MTGPEHFREAERLLAGSVQLVRESGERDRQRGVSDGQTPFLDMANEMAAPIIARAQVHATLALTAATAMNGFDQTGMHDSDYLAWVTTLEGPK